MTAVSERRDWTPAQRDRLTRLIADGATAPDAAAALGMSHAAVQSQMHRMSLRTARSVHECVRDAVIRRHLEGFRPRRIAVTVGVDLHIVDAVLKAHELVESGGLDDEIIALHQSGLTPSAIGTKLSLHYSTVKSALKKEAAKAA